MKFLTNVIKKHEVSIFNKKIFGYTIRISRMQNFNDITKRMKKIAINERGYKNPKIYIFDNAKSLRGDNINKICWAVYVEEQK